MIDGVQPIALWHHRDDTTTAVPSALLRRFRHRFYSQVADSAVPVNVAHWYFEGERPLPGDEIHESDGTVWTILEVNRSPLTSIWQTVCETFAFAEPTENVDHLRQDVVVASLPVRVGAMTTTLESTVSHRLTFYIRDSITVESNDVLRRSDGSLWKIVRVERPMYRARWTAVYTVQS
jgi:nicotinate-nucleotide pyrophosphorylase